MKPELRRGQILQAATKVFAEKGYHRASVSDIIKESNIARGTFYLYFEGKREIFAELVDVLTVRLIGCMRRVDLSSQSPPWIDQIRANFIRIATILVDERDLSRILYNHAMGLDEDFDKKIREFYETITRRTEAAFRLGQEMGLVRADINPRLTALQVVGSMKEVMYRLACEEDLGMSVEQVVDELISYSTQGILAGKNPAAKKSRGAVKRKK